HGYDIAERRSVRPIKVRAVGIVVAAGIADDLPCRVSYGRKRQRAGHREWHARLQNSDVTELPVSGDEFQHPGSGGGRDLPHTTERKFRGNVEACSRMIEIQVPGVLDGQAAAEAVRIV